jgi:tRNA threonylcarbamoyladenosine biosynthesis protein TsaB
MLILTIETSTPIERVAVVRDGTVLAEVDEVVGRGHTEKLLGAVESVLSRSSVDLDALDAVAVSIGPGRFSGLRVGLATAKGLAASSDLPVLPVETLAALAESGRPHEGLVCPMLDARRGEVYGALFRLDGYGRERLLPDAAAAPSAMLKSVAAEANGRPVLFLGSGVPASADEIAAVFGGAAVLPDAEVPAPTAAAIAALAEERELPEASAAATLEPTYLRGI